MQTRQAYVIESLKAVQNFIADHAGQVPAAADSGARHALDDVVADIDCAAGTQAGSRLGAMGVTRGTDELRASLLQDHMQPITRISRLERGATPELSALRMPRGEPSNGRLIADAHGMANVVERYRDAFVRLGMAPDFVEQLREAANALADSVGARRARVGESVHATASLESLLQRGRKLVAVLDAFVAREGRHDATLMAEWRHVQRVQGVPGRSRRRAKQQVAELQLPIVDPRRLLLPAPVEHVTIGSGSGSEDRVALRS